MNSRTLILILAVGLLGIGLILTLADLFGEEPVEQRVQVGVANQVIEPYTIVTSDMISAGTEMRVREAQDGAVYPFDAIVGKMTTAVIAPGELISAANARNIEEVRFTPDMNLEIVAFAASVDALVGGVVRPGHVINLYGTGSTDDGMEYTTLIEPRLWVVGVSAGGSPIGESTPIVNQETGEVDYGTQGRQERPSTLITVAVPPEKAFRIIDALGAQGLSPYVTLAANQDPVASVLATPAATATFGLDPNLALTATAIALDLASTPAPEPPRTGGGGDR